MDPEPEAFPKMEKILMIQSITRFWCRDEKEVNENPSVEQLHHAKIWRFDKEFNLRSILQFVCESHYLSKERDFFGQIG